MDSKNIIIAAIVALVVGAAAFYGGMKYQETRGGGNFARFADRNVRNFNSNGQARNGGQNVNAGNYRPVVGQILSIDNNTVTVKMVDGSSKIVVLSDSTTYSKTDSAAKQDLKVGDNIAAMGTSNSDGSLTAENIQLNPEFRAFGQRDQTPTPSQ